MKTKFLKQLSFMIADARMAVAYQTPDAQHKTEVAFAKWMEYIATLSESTRKRGDRTQDAIVSFYNTNQVQGLGQATWLCETCISQQPCAWKPTTPEKRTAEDLPPLPTLKRQKTEIYPGDDDVLAELLSNAPTQISSDE